MLILHVYDHSVHRPVMQTLRGSGSEICWHHHMLRFPPVLSNVFSAVAAFCGTHLTHSIFTYMDLSTHLSPVFFLCIQSAIHFASVQISKCINTELMLKWTSWDSIYREDYSSTLSSLNCNPPTSNIRRELLRNSELQSPHQFYSIRICILTQSWIGSYMNIEI